MLCRRMPFGRRVALWRTRATLVVISGCLICLLSSCAITVALPGATPSPTSNNPMTVALNIERGSDNSTLAIAPVYIGSNGPFNFIVDTGASVSLIRRGLASQLGLPKSGSRQPVSGIGGVQQIDFVGVSHWRAGQIALPNGSIGSGTLTVSAGSSSVDGLLGSDVWSQFGRVTIDYNAGTLTVYRALAA
jgi:Aspartyl protease